MKRSNKNRKFFNMGLAILVAIGLWLYVINVENPTGTATLWDMPIEIRGSDALDERGLMITGLSEDSLNVKFSGRKKTLMMLDRDTVALTLDVSDISEPGEWELACRVTYPSYVNANNVTVAKWDDMYVTVAVEEKALRQVSVRGSFIGTEAEGFQAGKVQTEPSVLTLEGPLRILETIEYALVQVGGEKVSSTIVEKGNLIFMDAEDTPVVDLKHVTASATTVQVTIPVRRVTSIPLVVTLRESENTEAADVTYEIEPETVTVAADNGAGELPAYISLGQIDPNGVYGTVSYSLPLRLPRGISGWNAPSCAEVTLSAEKRASRQLAAYQITLTNVPEGYRAELASDRVYVWVRGDSTDVSRLIASQISLRADLAGASLKEGLQRLPATVTLAGGNPGNVNVMGTNYAVAFRLVPETDVP